MQVINYSLQQREHPGLSVVINGIVEPGKYQSLDSIHAIALGGVRLGASIKGVVDNARLLPFAVDTICQGALIYAIIGEITTENFKVIARRSESNILPNLLLQFPDLLVND